MSRITSVEPIVLKIPFSDGSTGVGLMPIDSDYFHLIDQFSTGPRSLADAARLAARAGVPRDDVPGMAESLVEEGVRITGDRPPVMCTSWTRQARFRHGSVRCCIGVADLIPQHPSLFKNPTGHGASCDV